MAASDAMPLPKKNVGYRHYFALRDNAGALVTTWAGQDSNLSKDGANYVAATNEAVEIQTSGTGYIDLTSGEMNYDHVTLKVEVTNTDALDYVCDLFPEEAGDVRADITQVAGTSARATDLAEIAQYLFQEAAVLTDIVADDSVLAQMLAIDGDISDYDDTTDSQEAMRDAVAVVLAAIETDTIPELGVGAPAASPTLKTSIMLLYMALRNQNEGTSILSTITNDAGVTICSAVLDDDGVTYTKSEYGAP